MPVKSRVLLGVTAGLLLLLPLALTLSIALYSQRWTQGTDGPGFSPVLSQDEQFRLNTFQQRCEKREDCDPPLECLPLFTGGESYCLDSDCLTDLQCNEDFTCRALKPRGRGPLVRRCVPAGTSREGEPCIPSSREQDVVCERGLICNGYCGRPCQLDEPTSCPEGFFCARGKNGTSCLPSCEESTCQEGMQCVRYDSGMSVCARVRGENCQEVPCPEGQRCRKSYTPGDKEWVSMECVTPCDRKNPSCPEGFLCHRGACRRPCSPKKVDSCGPRQSCSPGPPGGPWVCRLRFNP